MKNLNAQTLNAHDKKELGVNLRKTLQQTTMLPPLPETARKLLLLRNKPDANIEELVVLVEEDPILAAFVMKYARMAAFGYSGRITSVHHAISLVLGYTTTLNVTMGIAASGCLKMPNYGPLGRVRIWSDALECAQLCRELCRHMKNKQDVNPGFAYLGGLLHDFGFMLFAHFCPQEFADLNEMVSADLKQDIRTIEMQNFGITHDIIGSYLLKAWDLPEEIAIIAAEHHFPDYNGEHAAYVKLVATANRLLQKKGIFDNCEYVGTSALLADLGISESKAEEALQQVYTCQTELKELALGLVG